MLRPARFAVFSALLLFAAHSAVAATYVVTKIVDTNDGQCDADCSLREAIAAANATPENDVIVFDPVLFHSPRTVVSSGTEMVIANNGSLSIFGPGALKLTLDGNQSSRILTVGPGAVTNINGIRFTRGTGAGAVNTGRGGAIYNVGGTLVLSNSIVTGNTAANGGGLNNAASAAPALPATLTIINCIVSNNTSTASGGAMQNFSTSSTTIIGSTFSGNSGGSTTGGGGGQYNGMVRISNSTFSGNNAPQGPGGGMQSNGSLLLLTNVTITNNSSSANGGGLHRATTNANGFIRNTIIAGNNGAAASPDVTNSAGGIASQGNNLIGNVGTSTGWVPSDITNVSPVLGPLASNGGLGMTHALLAGSPAANAGDNCVSTLTCTANNPPEAIVTDSRATSRSDGQIDIGSYEETDDLPAFLPNALLNGSYSHTLAPNGTGFTFTPVGMLPEGVSISNNGNEVLLSGMPTAAGSHFFQIATTSASAPANTITHSYALTVSSDPDNIGVRVRFLYLGGAPREKFPVTVTGLHGDIYKGLSSHLGYVQIDGLIPGSLYTIGLESKEFGSLSVSFIGQGTFALPDVEISNTDVAEKGSESKR